MQTAEMFQSNRNSGQTGIRIHLLMEQMQRKYNKKQLGTMAGKQHSMWLTQNSNKIRKRNNQNPTDLKFINASNAAGSKSTSRHKSSQQMFS
jgi:hypothetical protein